MLLVSGASKNVAALGPSRHLGVLLTPDAGNLPPSGFDFALDNSAFKRFNEARFERMLRRHAAVAGDALWCCAPDVVGDAEATRALFAVWEPRIRAAGYRVAYVLQDGETPERCPWSCDAVFVGGTTRWKESRAARLLVEEAQRRGKRTHMGRVNTYRRMRIAVRWGVDSIDGTRFSKWANRWLAQGLAWIADLEQRKAITLEQQETLPW